MFKHLLNTHPKRSTDPEQIFTKISHFKSPKYIYKGASKIGINLPMQLGHALTQSVAKCD